MPLDAMLFDMDGTITRPMLDFPAIKAEIGLPPDSYILEELERMSPEARRRAMVVVERHEAEAAEASELNDGATTLLDELAQRGIRTAVITRNSMTSCRTVAQRHGLRFDTLVCRDSAEPKPSPAGILLALERLDVAPHRAVYVGDHPIDVTAGRAAGTRTVWVTNGHAHHRTPPADYVVTHPLDIVHLLDEMADR